MFGYSSLSAVVFVIVLCYSQAIEDEPTFSKMLETMVRMEGKMDQWNKERKTFEENVLAKLEHCREEKIAGKLMNFMFCHIRSFSCGLIFCDFSF
jgi:hypothetical protein